MTGAWNAFWFSSSRRHSIGFFRVLLCAWLITDFLTFLPGLDDLDARGGEFMHPSAGLRATWWIRKAFGFEALRRAAWILAPLAMLGLGTRASLLLLALANFTLRAWHSSWVYVGHASILPSLALFVLVVAPGVKAWSLDGAIEGLFAKRRGESFAWLDRLAGRPAPLWPIHLILAACALLYFSAGVAKLRWAGGDWLNGSTLQWYLQGKAGQKRLGDSTQFYTANRAAPEAERFRDPWGVERIANSTLSTPAGRAVGASRGLCALLAWASLLIELGFALVFVLPRFGQYALLASAAAFHAGIGALMGIDFGGWAVLFLVAVDWNALLRQLPALLPGVGIRRAS